MKQSIRELFVSMLKSGTRQLKFNNELIVDDNMSDDAIPADDDQWHLVYRDRPIKLAFTMTLLCTQGRFRARLNLMEYEIHAHEMLVILPHSIIDEFSVTRYAQMLMFSRSPEFALSDADLTEIPYGFAEDFDIYYDNNYADYMIYLNSGDAASWDGFGM